MKNVSLGKILVLFLSLFWFALADGKQELIASVSALRLEMTKKQVLRVMGPPRGTREQLDLTILSWDSPQTSVVFCDDTIVSIGGGPFAVGSEVFYTGERVERIEKVIGKPSFIGVGRKYAFKNCLVEITEEDGFVKCFFLRRIEENPETN